jgi:hypothetical protein
MMIVMSTMGWGACNLMRCSPSDSVAFSCEYSPNEIDSASSAIIISRGSLINFKQIFMCEHERSHARTFRFVICSHPTRTAMSALRDGGTTGATLEDVVGERRRPNGRSLGVQTAGARHWQGALSCN